MKSLFSRTAYSLWHHKRRNILITVWLFLLLFLLVSVTIISIASSQQVANLNNTVGNSLIVTKYGQNNSEEPGRFYSSEIESLSEHPSVQSFNAAGYNSGVLVDAKPVVKDKASHEEYVESSISDLGTPPDDCKLFGVTNSKLYTLFTSGGLQLEDGIDITADNASDHVALISSQLAEANNLKIGDSISLRNSYIMGVTLKPLTLTIIGLFDYPKNTKLYKNDVLLDADQPANYIFIPEETLTAYSGYYAPYQVYVYLNEAVQMQRYIDEMQMKLGDSYYDPAAGATFNYKYTWDQAWFSTVSKPAAEISLMATATAVSLGIGIFTIILLVFAMLLNGKKHELGICLSLGESKIKLVIQTVLEEFVLLLTALCLACLLGILTAPAISKVVMGRPAAETNAAITQKREDVIRHENSGFYMIEDDIRSARTSFFVVNDEINVNDSIDTFMIYICAGIVVFLGTVTGQVVLFLRKNPVKLLIAK